MSKKTVLFIDNVCNKPYSDWTLANEAMGGTEATVVRVARSLQDSGYFNVYIEQHNREEGVFTEPMYIQKGTLGGEAHYIVCLRDPNSLLEARKRFPRAKVYLWSHDLSPREFGRSIPLFKETKTEANICVSNFHKQHTLGTLLAYGFEGEFKLKVIYNPIEDSLANNNSGYDKNKLVFFSSPHKGLTQAIELFKNLLSFNPDFKLYIANPGYFPDATADIKNNLVILGQLPHKEVIEHVRNSLCVFYPNYVFPETFGLVFAEANAVGTPVLTQAIGAAGEVLDANPDQLIDCRLPKPVIDRVMRWHRDGRPTVSGNPKFKLSRVIKQWLELLQ